MLDFRPENRFQPLTLAPARPKACAMTTYSSITTLQGREPADALADALDRLDPAAVGSFEIEDGTGLWEVAAYFDAPPDAVALALLAAAHGAKPFVTSALPETDWVAHVKRELAPVVAGRFFVHGSHDSDRVPEESHPLLIEAAMAFGTGHHGTTLGCLLAFDHLLTDGLQPAAVLDLGCGTAVLAMAAARVLNGASIVASDIDPIAIEVAATNIAANNLQGRVTPIVAAGLDASDITEAAPFDLIFANILMGPLLELAPAMSGTVAPNGHVILSGILNEQADSVLARYLANEFALEARDIHGDWTTLTLRRTA